ncbi:hypothetical protein FOG50_03771 [Hanseniaspora uvarum]|nr:hypothetical protein FOG50_03771 [Hanseniaspora uvarum]
MKFVLEKLIAKVGAKIANYSPVPVPAGLPKNAPVADSTPLAQEWLWNELGEFLEEGDIVVTETGTSAFGINQTRFPTDAYGISQVLWGSIGYSVGAMKLLV